MISFKLTKNDEALHLTDNTIKDINLTHTETPDSLLVRKIHDVELFIEVENANIDEAYAMAEDDDGKQEPLPREVDSVRKLCNYALAGYDDEYCYLDGELEIKDGFTQSVSRFEYKDLFVLKFEEKFRRDTKDTVIYALLREKAR